MDLAEADPKGLVRESYRIEGITLGECRSIFLDWALSVPDEAAIAPAVAVLLAVYGTDAPEHPMTAVLGEARAAPDAPRRKGGRAGRVSG
jgi:hypothetical protein